MDLLVVDTNHGALFFSKYLSENKDLLPGLEDIWVLDVYGKLEKEKFKNMNILDIDKLKDFCLNHKNLLISSPIHCPINHSDKFNENNFKTILKNEEYDKIISHHDLVYLILKKWKEEKDIKVIEVTGVKGKTSVVSMLKLLFIDLKPLELSSLGSKISELKSGKIKEDILKKDISITPASIVETVELSKDKNYGIAIFESSLGGTGLADVGLITNIVENYLISQKTSNAAIAKYQMFKSKITCIEYETLKKYYPKLSKEIKINTYSLDSNKANLYAKNISYGFLKTNFTVHYKDLITVDDEKISGKISIETYAPGSYQVKNVLAAILVALTFKIADIQERLKFFKPLKGRSSVKKINNVNIIEEINPGINVYSIEKSIDMIKHFKDSIIIIGGKYGVTCEEIDEKSTAELLDRTDEKILLTEELGKNIKKNMKSDIEFIANINDCERKAISYGAKNILKIYRSDYYELENR